MKATSFFLLTFLVISAAFSQNIQIQTEANNGYGPLNVSRTFIYDFSSLGVPPRAADTLKPTLTGIPEDWSYSYASSQILNYSQLLYHGSASGNTSQKSWDDYQKRVMADISELSRGYVN